MTLPFTIKKLGVRLLQKQFLKIKLKHYVHILNSNSKPKLLFLISIGINKCIY